MIKLDNTKRTRFKLTVFNNTFFAIITIIALILGYPEVGVACISEMGIVTAVYLGSDTYRPSVKQE